ncbi:hypothetical protein [Rubripirellula reticaptiva]|uniref:hypothetical protein n=1 Tax=Rubripirellula reticaptiva TaxID=2528013 RepID=UPI001644E00F|nr:hypothetical protein [Rubripirellula reticaptiva]
MLGNSSHGGISNNKLDHALYISGDASRNKGVELGWNYCYDNQYAIGPMIVVNHQGNRIPKGKSCKGHAIHDNFVDCQEFAGRGIGIYSMSWENAPGEPEPETAKVYNNIVIGAGFMDSSSSAIYCLNGKAAFYHNTLIACRGHGLTIGGEDVLSVSFQNNIVHMASGGKYIYLVSGSEDLLFSNNLYAGLDRHPDLDTSSTLGPTSLDDQMIPSTTGNETASAIPIADARLDFWGARRPSNRNSDIGACQHFRNTQAD